MKRPSSTLLVLSGIAVGLALAWACGPDSTRLQSAVAQTSPNDAGSSATPGTPATPSEEPPSSTTAAPPAVPAGVACRQWQVALTGILTIPYGPYEPATLQEGWEPFAYYDGQGTVVVRRCINWQ